MGFVTPDADLSYYLVSKHWHEVSDMIFYTDIAGQLVGESHGYICATPHAMYVRTPDGDERAVQMHWLERPAPPKTFTLSPLGYGTLEKFPWD